MPEELPFTDITELLTDEFIPKHALILYKSTLTEDVYVEAYDVNRKNQLVNAHPLSPLEAKRLADQLNTTHETATAFLTPEGLLPDSVLSMKPSDKGYVIWYTPASKRTLYFTDSLGIPTGEAMVPPLVWKARKQSLEVFALKVDEKPTVKTRLYRAPFFNTSSTGSVCMGSVKTRWEGRMYLERFMHHWESLFFSSYFSHVTGSSPTKSNLVLIWKKLLETQDTFPADQLLETTFLLNDILA